MESTLGVDRTAWVPEYAGTKFRSSVARSTAFPVKDGSRTPGKVAIFSTCYINYNEPGIGHDLTKILAHNEIPYVIAEKEACCGMPKLELGDLQAVAANKDKNIPVLAKLAREGYAIVTPIPSCTLMFKQELPLMFPDDADVQAVQGGDVRPVRVPRRAPEGRAPQDGLQEAAGQGLVPHPLPFARAERRPEDARGARARARTPRSIPWSAARGTPAPGAARRSSTRWR